jgi:acyl-CoA thioesterase-1
MGHEDQRRAPLAFEGEHQIDDRRPIGFVEIAGRLVGTENRGIRGDRAGEGYPLLFAPGQLGGIMGQALGETYGLQFLPGAGEGIFAAGQFERNCDIFQRRHSRNEVEGLKYNADPAASEAGQRIFVKPDNLRARNENRSGLRPLEPRKRHEQGRFARSGRADQPDGLACGNGERNTLENVDTRGAPPQTQVDVAQADRRRVPPQGSFHHTMPPFSPLVASPRCLPDSLLQRRYRTPRSPYGVGVRILQFALWLALIAGLCGQTRPGPADAAAPPLRIVALGDSLTAGYQLPADASFPAVLENQLRARGFNVEVANAGVSGDTASGGLERLDWSVPDGTDLVIVELGANDMLRGIEPSVTRAALAAILERLKGRGIKILLAGMLATPSLGDAYRQAFDAIFPALAQTYQVPLYPFFLDGVMAEPKLSLPDGLHPNRAGVETIVARLLPALVPLLAAQPAP